MRRNLLPVLAAAMAAGGFPSNRPLGVDLSASPEQQSLDAKAKMAPARRAKAEAKRERKRWLRAPRTPTETPP